VAPIQSYGATVDECGTGRPPRPTLLTSASDFPEAASLLEEDCLEDLMYDEDAEEEDAVSRRASIGVKTVEASQRVSTPPTRWALFIGCN
jgi:hypothetical protein